MKARVHIMLKNGVLDPQGEAVLHALGTLGFGGVEGVRQGKRVRLGRPSWASEIVRGSDETQNATLRFAIEDEAAYGFQLTSALRPDVPEALGALQHVDVEVAILSGDITSNVAAIALEAGNFAFQAELTPAEKTQAIKERQDVGAKVLMVGDGINDAPALGAAHTSLAPSTASDIGRTAADLVFTGSSLLAVHDAIEIARKSARLVRENFAMAALYNLIAVPVAAAGFASPLVAAIAMSGSSLVVTGNALRLHLMKQSGEVSPTIFTEHDHQLAESPIR